MVVVIAAGLYPVESSTVSRNSVPLASGNCGIEYEPWPLLNADGGTGNE